MARQRSLRARLALLAVGLLVGILLAECSLRVAGVSYPLYYYPDDFLGARLRPRFAGWYRREGRAFFRVNRFGFRDREHAVAKPVNTVRVAVLGDSFAEALQVPLKDTFWSVLEQRLTESTDGPASRFEVLNFGVSGYGTAQQLQALRHHVWQFEPDIVLLAFFAGNDVRNNSKQLEPQQLRPFFHLDETGQLVLDQSFLEHTDYIKSRSLAVRLKIGLINASRLLQLANQWKSRPRLPDRDSPLAVESGLDQTGFGEPHEIVWRNAWDITDALIVQMHDEVRRRGAKFFVATVPSAIEVDPRPSQRQAVSQRLGEPDWEYAERRIQTLGAKHGFSVIALAGPMRQHAESGQVYLHGFTNTQLGTGHWNAAGHRLAGRLIYESVVHALRCQAAVDSDDVSDQ